MKLLIVIVNFHGAAHTIECLRSLRNELAALPDAQIGLCENGSGEAELTRIRSAMRELELEDRVALTSIHPNLGFTGGNNAVIRPALSGKNPPDAVMLLNNDTIVTPGAISVLLQFLVDHPHVGICGSRLEFPDGSSQLAARRVLTAASEFESYLRFGVVSRIMRRWIVTPPEREQPHECGWVPGAALMIRREVLEDVGLLDEDLYTYFDDVDYCIRSRHAGWPTWFVPESRIIHLVGQTTGVTREHEAPEPKRRAEYWFLARRHYFLKHFGAAYTAAADSAAILALMLWKTRMFLQRRVDPDPPRFLIDFVRHSVWRTGFRLRSVPNPAI